MSQQPPQGQSPFWGNMQPPQQEQPFNSQFPSGQYRTQQAQFPQPQGYPQGPYPTPRYPQQQYQQQQPMMPPPTSPKKKAWYKRPWGIVLLIFLALAACGGISNAFSHNAIAPTSTTPVPTDTPVPQPSNAFNLAMSDAGGNIPDKATIDKYQTLLDSLHKKTGDSEQTISDETVNGQALVKSKYGKDVSLLELLQQTDASDPGGNVKIHYNEVLAAYIILAYGQQSS